MVYPDKLSAKEISLGEDFGDIAVSVNGVRVEIAKDGDVRAFRDGNVEFWPISNDDGKAAASADRKIGDKMPDGTVYAGISPDTGKDMYAMPADASLTMTFNGAQKYAAKLDAHGHKDWRVPTKAELNVLFNNRAEIGGFNGSASDPACWYWSASSNNEWDAWAQRFSDGCQPFHLKGLPPSSVRCVR